MENNSSSFGRIEDKFFVHSKQLYHSAGISRNQAQIQVMMNYGGIFVLSVKIPPTSPLYGRIGRYLDLEEEIG